MATYDSRVEDPNATIFLQAVPELDIAGGINWHFLATIPDVKKPGLKCIRTFAVWGRYGRAAGIARASRFTRHQLRPGAAISNDGKPPV
jgi:hypothetical protein